MSEQATGTRTLTDAEREAMARDIPLPPEGLRAELDNTPAAAPSAAPTPAAEVAVLDFVDGPPGKTLTLRHPFRLDGRVVDVVTVRPLTVAETSEVIERLSTGHVPETMDFYAVMTGLPAAVLRALPGLDGQEVTGAAYDFLPRFMKADASPPTRGDGDA